jgi:diguanylate cyclase (GGDEF)-like protein
MSLRTKITLALVGTLALLALLIMGVLRSEAQVSAQRLERAESKAELKRLLFALESQSQLVLGVLTSWSNWTDLYRHAQQPSAQFRDSELMPSAIAVSNVDWLLLYDSQGRLVDTTEVPMDNGQTPLADEVKNGNVQFPQGFARRELTTGCGAVSLGGVLSLACYAPLLDSDGRGQPAGLVIMGRRLDAGILATVGAQTQLTFSLDMFTPQPLEPVEGPLELSRMFPERSPLVKETPTAIELRQPMVGLLGRHIADVVLVWPRRSHSEVYQTLENAQWVTILMVMTSGIVIVLLVNRLVINRLTRMRETLQAIVSQKQWQGSVGMRTADEIGELSRFIDELLGVVQQQVEHLEQLNRTDALTQLPNRRAFDERLAHLINQHRRSGYRAALLMLDLDHFKGYNDRLGHPAGDEALRQVATCLQTTVRTELDLPARLGGEEFAVLVEDATFEGALELAERIRRAIEALQLAHDSNPPANVLTVSIGVATLNGEDTAITLYQRADAALYQAKMAGRNRVCSDPQDHPSTHG